MLFKKVVGYFEKLERTSSSNKMSEILAELFKKSSKSVDIVAYLALGELGSSYAGKVTGMADKMVLKAIASAFGQDESEVKALFKKIGDVGLVAEKFCRGRGSLKLKNVFNEIKKIALASGAKSQDVKIKYLAGLLKKASPIEARYLARMVTGTMRVGFSVMTILSGLAIAFTGDKRNKEILERAYNNNPDIGDIAKRVASKGLKGLSGVGVAMGRPIKMMLAQRVKSIEDIFRRMPAGLAAEEKYDGERIQAHKKDNQVVLFSRRMENISAQYPDVVEYVKKLSGRDFIIEGEVVPIDSKGRSLPFQKLMQRRRKYDVEKYVKSIPVCYYLFDLLSLNGRSYIKKAYPVRHKALRGIVKKSSRNLQLAKRKVIKDVKEFQEFFKKSLARGNEGLIAKSLSSEAVYKAGTRGWLWIKWKKEYVKGMQDTFDLVVVGGFYGRGRRSGTYGSLLCAAYNGGKFETVTKLGAGFTDNQLAEFKKKFDVVSEKPEKVVVHKSMKPDVWFKPSVVVEVLGAEITRSPIHRCNVKKGKGLAIRFPRFIRYRDDKSVRQATTSKEIERMFKR
ncbi:MAG: ATP-dependent DNA ligase [Nanoarchaeota archaeon]|nr:ATP-dependent DNA ligase [Nanoarchaeota archaeon]